MLLDSAISSDVLDASGIRSTPQGIEFPWTDGTSATVWQKRPDAPRMDKDGRPVKYEFPKGAEVPFNRLRDGGAYNRLIVAEGTKQQYAVLSHAPTDMAVYGMSGCWGSKHADLSVAEGREVFLLLDADMESNLDVWVAAEQLTKQLKGHGAKSVRYVATTGTGKEGVDDVLSKLPEDKRAHMLKLWLSQADTKLPKRPKAKLGKGDGRPTIDVSDERRKVITDLVDAMAPASGVTLFNHGDELARYNVAERRVDHLDDGAYLDTLADHVVMYRTNERGQESYGYPDAPTGKAVRSRLTASLPVIHRVANAPFLRKDGSLCDTPGYDAATGTYLEIPEDLKLSVPDAPTRADVAAAVSFLLDEWVGDVLFATDEDRTAFLALLITWVTRTWYPVVPLCVFNGLDKGVGKGLCAELTSRVFTGHAPSLSGLSDQDEEQRKAVTSLLSGAPEVVFLDELHTVGGKTLARLMTAPVWSDRILGRSVQAQLPNEAVWVSMGNQVVVQDDMIRRYFQIRLSSDQADPYARPVDGFRHPDIHGWTEDNRGRILSAVLTLVRAWIKGGKTRYRPNMTLASFEGWQHVVEGVLRTAGRTNFLATLAESRAENDVTGSYWTEHLAWLHGKFADNRFTAKDVVTAAKDDTDYPSPPGADQDADARALGYVYRKATGQFKGGYRLVKDGTVGRMKSSAYRIEAPKDELDTGDNPFTRETEASVEAELRAALARITELEAALAAVTTVPAARPEPVAAPVLAATNGGDPFAVEDLGYNI